MGTVVTGVWGEAGRELGLKRQDGDVLETVYSSTPLLRGPWAREERVEWTGPGKAFCEKLRVRWVCLPLSVPICPVVVVEAVTG